MSQTGKVIICGLNGIGSLGAVFSTKRRYLTHTIHDVLGLHFPDLPAHTFYDKGGPDPRPERNMLSAVQAHSSPDNVLVLVGFSYGARDIVRDVLRPYGRWLKAETKLLQFNDIHQIRYKAIYVVVVDADWITPRRENKVLRLPTVPGRIQGAWNVYQNEPWARGGFLGGTKLVGGAACLDVTNSLVTGVPHREMDTSTAAVDALHAAFYAAESWFTEPKNRKRIN